MIHYSGQYTMYLPNGQPYLPNSYTEVNGGSVSTNSVLAHTPPRQPQYQPMTPQSIPRRLPGSQWAGTMSNGQGQQQTSVQNQTTRNTSSFPAVQPNLGQQPHGGANDFPSSYTAAYGNTAQPYQYTIPRNSNFDTTAGNQSEQNIASDAQVQDISSQAQMTQTRNMSASAQSRWIATQHHQIEQNLLLKEQKAQQQISHQPKVALQQASQLQAAKQQAALQQAAQYYAARSIHNNAAVYQPSYRVSSGTSQVTQAAQSSHDNGQLPSSAKRTSPTALPASPQKNRVAQNSPYTPVLRTPTLGNAAPALKRSLLGSGQKTPLQSLQTPVINHQQRNSFTGKATPQPNHTSLMDPIEQRAPKSNNQRTHKGKESPSQSSKSMHPHNTSPITTANGQRNNSAISQSSPSLNGRHQNTASPIVSGNAQRIPSLVSSSSPPINGGQQQIVPTHVTPTVKMSHMPTLNRNSGIPPSQMQGKKRQAAHTSNDNGPAGKKQAIEGHNLQQDPNRYKTKTALEQLLASQARPPYQTKFSQQQAEQHAKFRREQAEQHAKLQREQEERNAKSRKEQEERNARWRQEQEELQREHQRLANLRLERERLSTRKKELQSDPSALYRHYSEYMKHFPDEDRIGRNPYLWRLLANQLMPIDTTTETAIAIAFAKEHWDWYMEYPKDVQRAYKEATKAKAPKRN